MCDFKLFKGIAFSESQVQDFYKKPESNPSNTTEYLERWYPMIEGNPESPQSIVYDHSEKKLGSELVTNGDMGNLADAGSNGYVYSVKWLGFKHWNNSGGESTQFSQSDNGGSEYLVIEKEYLIILLVHQLVFIQEFYTNLHLMLKPMMRVKQILVLDIQMVTI